MKRLFSILIIVLSGTFTPSCVLNKDEPVFQCEKNAPITIGGKELCAVAKVNRYIAPDTSINSPEQIGIGLSYSSGNFSIGIVTSEIKMGATYVSPGTYTNRAQLQYENFYTAENGYIRVTLLDRANRLISGVFDLSARNPEGSVVRTTGKFTNVIY